MKNKKFQCIKNRTGSPTYLRFKFKRLHLRDYEFEWECVICANSYKHSNTEQNKQTNKRYELGYHVQKRPNGKNHPGIIYPPTATATATSTTSISNTKWTELNELSRDYPKTYIHTLALALALQEQTRIIFLFKASECCYITKEWRIVMEKLQQIVGL